MIHMNVEVFTMVMEVLGLVSGVLGAFVIFFGFMSEKNEGRFSGRLGQLYSFLNFKEYIIEGMLKFLYVLAACLCTGIGLFTSLTVVNLSRGLVLLIGGNLAVRIAFEFLMMAVKACRNLGEIGKERERAAYERPEREAVLFRRRKKEEAPDVKLAPPEKKRAAISEPVDEENGKGEDVQKDSAQEDGRRVDIRKEDSKREVAGKESKREDSRKEIAGEAAVTEEINRKEVHRAEAGNGGPEIIVQENKKPDRRIALMKSKYKLCPACGEKCSSEFAFCNMCGAKLP